MSVTVWSSRPHAGYREVMPIAGAAVTGTTRATDRNINEVRESAPLVHEHISFDVANEEVVGEDITA
jgi:hypothetical protein